MGRRALNLCVVAITISFPPVPHAEQQAFNRKRWDELCANSQLSQLDARIETDRHGHIIMTPPPEQDHGKRQYRIASLLERLMGSEAGVLMTECPISTSDGVKAADAAWISMNRNQKNHGLPCLTTAPEICVEVLSPSNSTAEMDEKKALYVQAGAEEVWFCSNEGAMTFFNSAGLLAASRLCADFPPVVELR
jgi:Uma2 family endonuclease